MQNNIILEKIEISTDKSRLDLNLIWEFLSNSYWASGREKYTVKNSIENSLCFGVFHDNKQIGFARVVTDSTLFAYIADVFILEEFRGCGYSKKLIDYILKYEELRNVKRWLLSTSDAHNLYKKFGFQSLSKPDNMMELKRESSAAEEL